MRPIQANDKATYDKDARKRDSEIEQLRRRVTELEIALELYAPNHPALSQIPENPAGDLEWVRTMGDTLRETVRELRVALREIADTALQAADLGVVGLGTVQRIAKIAAEALEE